MSQSKDNTCPACMGTGKVINSIPAKDLRTCDYCHGSGQQEDKPTTIKAHTKAVLEEHEPALKELGDKPTNLDQNGHCKGCHETEGYGVREDNGRCWCCAAPLTDSKPEKPSPYCKEPGHAKHYAPGTASKSSKPDQLPVNELGEILTKFSPDLTDVQHIKLMQAIEALISRKLVEELQNLPIGRTPTIQVEIINKRINEIEVSNG